MPAAIPALNALDGFIGVARELAKLPALVLPQYQSAARDLYKICQKLLTANEYLSRWLHRFLYFDFRQQDVRTEFLEAVSEYRTMKSGPEFQQLKYSCGDISLIYGQEIASKLGNWFTRTQKREEVEGIFASLGDADDTMVRFIYDYVMAKLDDFVRKAEEHVDAGAMDDAEQLRLEFKAESREITESLERFSGELSDLMIRFAQIARVPVTLGA